jgi:hypothetical protein
MSKTKTVAAATWAFMTEIRLRFALSSEEERKGAGVHLYCCDDAFYRGFRYLHIK